MLSALGTWPIIPCFARPWSLRGDVGAGKVNGLRGDSKREKDAAELSLGGEVPFLLLLRSLWVWAGFSHGLHPGLHFCRRFAAPISTWRLRADDYFVGSRGQLEAKAAGRVGRDCLGNIQSGKFDGLRPFAGT